MNTSSKKYAIALYETAKETKGLALTEALKNFVKLLVKNGLMGKADQVIKDFSQYYNEAEGIVAATVTTARELSRSEANDLSDQLAKVFGKKIELDCQVDPGLIGGAIFRVGDYLIDGSLKQKLFNLSEKISGKN